MINLRKSSNSAFQIPSTNSKSFTTFTYVVPGGTNTEAITSILIIIDAPEGNPVCAKNLFIIECIKRKWLIAY